MTPLSTNPSSGTRVVLYDVGCGPSCELTSSRGLRQSGQQCSTATHEAFSTLPHRNKLFVFARALSVARSLSCPHRRGISPLPLPFCDMQATPLAVTPAPTHRRTPHRTPRRTAHPRAARPGPAAAPAKASRGPCHPRYGRTAWCLLTPCTVRGCGRGLGGLQSPGSHSHCHMCPCIMRTRQYSKTRPLRSVTSQPEPDPLHQGDAPCSCTLRYPRALAHSRPQLDKLTSEVEALRACIRALEGALSDYKAGRAPFSALSAALERGQRTADKCAAVQTQLEVGAGARRGGGGPRMAGRARRGVRPYGLRPVGQAVVQEGGMAWHRRRFAACVWPCVRRQGAASWGRAWRTGSRAIAKAAGVRIPAVKYLCSLEELQLPIRLSPTAPSTHTTLSPAHLTPR